MKRENISSLFSEKKNFGGIPFDKSIMVFEGNMWSTDDGGAEFYALTTPMLVCISRGSRYNVLSATLTLVGSFLGAEEDTVIGPVLATLERAVGQCVILANAPPATVSGPNSTQPTTTATPLRVLQQCTPKREREPSPRPPSSDVQAPGLQGVRSTAPRNRAAGRRHPCDGARWFRDLRSAAAVRE